MNWTTNPLPASLFDEGLNPHAPDFVPDVDVPQIVFPRYVGSPDAKLPLESDAASQLNPNAADFIPTCSFAQLSAKAEAWAQQATKRQMPYATDEEWEQRINKREKEVETIKSLPSYKIFLEMVPKELRTSEDPRTPDPTDRAVSKRMWKWNVEKWRLQIKGRCVYRRETLLQYSRLGMVPSNAEDRAGYAYQPPVARHQHVGKIHHQPVAPRSGGTWKLIDPLCVRFSQPRIRPNFQDGRRIDEAVAMMTKVSMKGFDNHYDELLKPPFPPISIIAWAPKLRHAGGVAETDSSGGERIGERAWFTFDNRRLYSLQRAAVERWPSRCCIVVRCIEDVPANSSQVRKFQTTTEGVSVEIGRRNDEKEQLRMSAWKWTDQLVRKGAEVAAVPVAPTLAAMVAARTENVSAKGLYSGDPWSKDLPVEQESGGNKTQGGNPNRNKAASAGSQRQ